MRDYDFSLIFCPRWGAKVPWTAPAYLIAAVRSKGFKVQFLDYNIRLFWDNLTPELWLDNIQHQFWKTQNLDYFLDQIDLGEIKAPIVGFSLTETNIRFSVELARRLRKFDPQKIIIFGGHRVFFPEDAEREVPTDSCDAIVKGEGEITLLDILENGLNKNIGTYTPEEGHWVFNGERSLIRNLDMFPWPRYEDTDWKQFPMREMNIMGGRGCVFRCAFCNDIVRAGFKYRKRSAEHIAEELLYHKEANNIRFTVFNDPILNADYDHLDRLCEILIKKEYNLPWAGNFSIRRNMPVDLMQKAKHAGFTTAIIGLESGSRHVLSLMKKPSKVDDARLFINALYDAGIKVDLNIVVGFPGETEEDFIETMDLITELAPKISQIISICTLNVDRSYLFDHLDLYNVNITNMQKRHIDWSTKDGSNTYEIRCERANRLIKHAVDLKLTYDRFDADIEQKNRLINIDEIKRRRHFYKDISLVRSGVRPLYIWGAGRGGSNALEMLKRSGFDVSGFIDKNPSKRGEIFEGLPILTPEILMQNSESKERPYIVIGSLYEKEIVEQLEKWGYEEVKDFQRKVIMY